MTLKEIASEMTKVRNLSTIIEKKKDEFAFFLDGMGFSNKEIEVILPQYEKAIRESVEEALREMENTGLITEPNEFESWVKEFMK